MDDDAIREVVDGGKSLYDPPERPDRRLPTLVVVCILVVAVAVVVAIVMAQSDDTAAPTTTTSSDLPDADDAAGGLVAFAADPPALYYPTLLPAGMELCEATLGRPIAGDEFCDPDQPDRWIRVAVVDGVPMGGDPVGDPQGLVVIENMPPEVGIIVNDYQPIGYRLWASGIDLEELIAVAASLPIADPHILAATSEEPTVILDAGSLASVVRAESAEIRSEGEGTFGLSARGLDVFTGIATYGPTDRSVAAGLVKPVLISREHALVVGAEDQPSDGVRAFWTQGGRWWNIRVRGTFDDAVARAQAMEAAIAELPTEDPPEAGTPGAVAGAAMVWLPDPGAMLLYGGVGPPGASSGTYLLDGTLTWSNVGAGAGPGPRFDHAMVYVPPLDAVLVFGGTRSYEPIDCTDGECVTTFLADSWLWDVGTGSWSEVETQGEGPSARRGARMVWDPGRRTVVLVGGELEVDDWVYPLPPAGDTWLFDPATLSWSELETEDPIRAVARPGIVYDPVNDRVLVFGGDAAGVIADDTLWALEGSTWTEVAVEESPPARFGHSFVWDSSRSRAVLTGGVGRILVPIAGGTQAEIAQLPDVWTFDPIAGTWTEHDVSDTPIALHRAVAVDEATGALVAFGGDLFDGRYEIGSSSFSIIDDLDFLDLATLTWR